MMSRAISRGVHHSTRGAPTAGSGRVARGEAVQQVVGTEAERDAAARGGRCKWQNNRPRHRRPLPMTSSTGNRSDGHGLCHGLDSAPAPRMSAPTQSHDPTCARAARGRAGRRAIFYHPHAWKLLLLPCSRRSSWPQALTLRRTREGMQDAHSSVSDRRSSSSAARTLFRRCSTPSRIGRFKFSSHSHIDRPSTHYDAFTPAFIHASDYVKSFSCNSDGNFCESEERYM